jgi:subtilase family serine protease
VRSRIDIPLSPHARASTELEQLLGDLQDPVSPLYHAWLTPEEYGRRFGLAEDDLKKVADWIESQTAVWNGHCMNGRGPGRRKCSTTARNNV